MLGVWSVLGSVVCQSTASPLARKDQKWLSNLQNLNLETYSSSSLDVDDVFGNFTLYRRFGVGLGVDFPDSDSFFSAARVVKLNVEEGVYFIPADCLVALSDGLNMNKLGVAVSEVFGVPNPKLSPGDGVRLGGRPGVERLFRPSDTAAPVFEYDDSLDP